MALSAFGRHEMQTDKGIKLPPPQYKNKKAASADFVCAA